MLDTVSDDVKALAASIPEPPGPEFPEDNIAYRAEIVKMGNESPEFAAAWHYKCSLDPVYWMNTVAWTQNSKDFPNSPHRPVILFPPLDRDDPEEESQEGFIRWLDDHVNRGVPGALQKSREQLASVGTANYILWRLIYKENADCLVGSYKEDVVDGPSYAMSIFPKIDYTIDFMADWMLPTGWNRKKPGPNRKHMTFISPTTGRAIMGETCNDKFGRGGRPSFIWVDEFAHIKLQEMIHTAIAQATHCYLYTTTPNGIEKFASLIRNGNIDYYTLHWTSNYLWHPKGHKPSECCWHKRIWPEKWVCQPGCKAHPNGGKPHSERYDRECQKLDWDQKKIAQELDICYEKSGGAVFDQDKVVAAMDHLVKNPIKFKHYSLSFDMRGAKPIVVDPTEEGNNRWYEQVKALPVLAQNADGGDLRVWKEPFSCRDKNCMCGGSGLHTYVLGGDVCRNMDGDSHCAYMYDATAGQTVAEWHGQGSVEHVALEWAKLCKWYGTSTLKQWRDAWAAVEANDVGMNVNENLVKLGIYVPTNRQESSSKKKRSPRFGIVLDKHNKPYIINSCLQPEIDNGDAKNSTLPRLCNPFPEFWKECQTYVYKYNDKTDQRPESAKMGAQTRKQHDDRVMSQAHAIYFCLTYYGKVRGYIPNHPQARNILWKAGAN